MDAKEAIVYMKKARSLHIERYGDNKKICLYDKAIEALEKQVPKEPGFVGSEEHGDLAIECPCCKETTFRWNNFCQYCGQAIKKG